MPIEAKPKEKPGPREPKTVREIEKKPMPRRPVLRAPIVKKDALVRNERAFGDLRKGFSDVLRELRKSEGRPHGLLERPRKPPIRK